MQLLYSKVAAHQSSYVHDISWHEYKSAHTSVSIHHKSTKRRNKHKRSDMEKISYQKLLIVFFALIFTFKDIGAAPIRDVRDNTCQGDARQKIQKGMRTTKEYINLLVGRIMITAIEHLYIIIYFFIVDMQ